MKKIIEWLLDSHHWLHIVIGLLVGFGSMGWYCAAYAGIGIAITSEVKDKMWGCWWDWADFLSTIVSVAVGYGIHGLCFGFNF